MKVDRNLMSTRHKRTRVVISFYDRRPQVHLKRLLDRMAHFDAGGPYDILIVVNSTGDLRIETQLGDNAAIVYRENTGMNIGAWNAGWLDDRSYEQYVFLQDECFPIRNDWLKWLTDPLQDIGIGLVGESFNPAWDADWRTLSKAHLGSELPDHFINRRPAPRVEVYLNAMKTWGIDPGDTGKHLRSLVWSMRRETLEQIGGFPIGGNYGECIAAEIGVSRLIESKGLRLEQAGPRPFHAVAHFEWNPDTPQVAHSHKRRPVHEVPPRSRAEMDYEAAKAWAQAVAIKSESLSGPELLEIISLKLKLSDRNAEIKQLRNALMKAKR